MTLCEPVVIERDWQDVPNEHVAQWREVFFSTKEGLNLSAPCPICGCRSLHKFYHLHRLVSKTIGDEKFIGDGSLWTWCSHCLSYEHYSAFVPEWWHDTLPVDEARLSHQPEALEEALNKVQ